MKTIRVWFLEVNLSRRQSPQYWADVIDARTLETMSNGELCGSLESAKADGLRRAELKARENESDIWVEVYRLDPGAEIGVSEEVWCCTPVVKVESRRIR